jgi:hypothetical protein
MSPVGGTGDDGRGSGEDGSGGRGTLLVTGAAGMIGARSAALCEREGWKVRRFDLVDGDDLLDLEAVVAATAGCDGS